MNEQEFKEGIEFFTCPVTLEIAEDPTLVHREGAVNAEGEADHRHDYIISRTALNQLPNQGRGKRCPKTRETLNVATSLNATDALKVFLAVAHKENLLMPYLNNEIDSEEINNEEIIAAAKNILNLDEAASIKDIEDELKKVLQHYQNGVLKIDPILEEKMQAFGVNSSKQTEIDRLTNMLIQQFENDSQNTEALKALKPSDRIDYYSALLQQAAENFKTTMQRQHSESSTLDESSTSVSSSSSTHSSRPVRQLTQQEKQTEINRLTNLLIDRFEAENPIETLRRLNPTQRLGYYQQASSRLCDRLKTEGENENLLKEAAGTFKAVMTNKYSPNSAVWRQRREPASSTSSTHSSRPVRQLTQQEKQTEINRLVNLLTDHYMASVSGVSFKGLPPPPPNRSELLDSLEREGENRNLLEEAFEVFKDRMQAKYWQKRSSSPSSTTTPRDNLQMYQRPAREASNQARTSTSSSSTSSSSTSSSSTSSSTSQEAASTTQQNNAGYSTLQNAGCSPQQIATLLSQGNWDEKERIFSNELTPTQQGKYWGLLKKINEDGKTGRQLLTEAQEKAKSTPRSRR